MSGIGISGFFNFLAQTVSKVMVVILLVIISFSVLKPVTVEAQNGANGVAGFTGCDFSSAKANPEAGAKLFENCIRQVLTFLFVIGLFLIVFRVGLAAFNNLNPGSDGNAIKSSVTAVRDIVIGLLLIVGPSIILATINPAALSLNFLNLGSLANLTGTSSNNNGGINNNSNNGSGNNGTNNNNPTNSNGTNNNPTTGDNTKTLPSQIKSSGDLQSTLDYFKANQNSVEARNTLKTYVAKQQNCSFIFIEASKVDECKDLNQNYSTVLNSAKETIGNPPPQEMPKSYSGAVAVSSDTQTITSLKQGNDQILIVRYLPNTDPTGFPNAKKETTLKISGCKVDDKITTPNTTLKFWNNLTNDSSCSMQVLSTININ